MDEYDNELFSIEKATVELVAKKLAFSFSPATEADEQALLDYLPDNPQTPDDLSDTIPADLFQVVGQFTIDGAIQSESSAIPFGRELKTRKGLWSERSGWQQTTNPVTTGEYQAIGLDLHGMSAAQLQDLQSNLDNTKTHLENQTYESLTKHDVVGDLLQAGVMGYLAMTQVQSQLTANASDIVYYREPSYGTFSTNSQLVYLFGQPHEVKMSGLLMDMDRLKTSAECKQNCWNNWVDYNKTTGHMLSAYEHIVPEQIFYTTDNPVEGISAVKALSIASAEGQRIYTINSANLATVIDELTIDQAVKDEIIQAVNAGYEVTTSQHRITKDSWSGVGYIIIDPQTGSGAYKISGGSDGAAFAAGFISGVAGAYQSIFESASEIGTTDMFAKYASYRQVAARLGAVGFLLTVISGAYSDDPMGAFIEAALNAFLSNLAGAAAVSLFTSPIVAGLVAALAIYLINSLFVWLI